MKALVCKNFGEQMQIGELPKPVPNANQVLISVKTCGLNFPDFLMVQGKYQVRPNLPFAAGAEVAGTVLAFGENVKNLQIGQAVFAATLYGGLAEQVLADAYKVFPIPQQMDFQTAAAISVTYGTVFHALFDRANLQKNETLLVLGAAGGIGEASIQLAKMAGATVIACASTAEKLDLCKKNGADHLINYQSEDFRAKIKEITNNKGVDVVIDPVGGNFTELALRSLAWKGRHLIVGFTMGEIPKIPMNLVLLKGCQIMGVFWTDFVTRESQKNIENFEKMFPLFANKTLNPTLEIIDSLENADAALTKISQRKALGKIVVNLM
ncbi:MAG: NADPH:quinone oxidoreductase family protein [Bacteroidetes bacterium]|nr:MAG: NADPH:quinone oxidoreductase family protein [Bacteroidota bacterium]